MRKQYRAYTVEIAVYDENTDSIFPEYVACNGYSCENAIKRAKEVLKMQGYKESEQMFKDKMNLYSMCKH